MHAFHKCRTNYWLLTTYSPIDEEVSLEGHWKCWERLGNPLEEVSADGWWFLVVNNDHIICIRISWWLLAFYLPPSYKRYHHLPCYLRTQLYHHLILCNCSIILHLFVISTPWSPHFSKNVLKWLTSESKLPNYCKMTLTKANYMYKKPTKLATKRKKNGCIDEGFSFCLIALFHPRLRLEITSATWQ